MSEENSEQFSDSKPRFQDSSDYNSTNLNSKISKSKSKGVEIKRFFRLFQKLPWSVLFLGVTRLLFLLTSYLKRNASVVVKSDGSTAYSRIVRINKFLKYPYVPDKVPVLSIVLAPYPVDTALSMLSALGVIFTVILTVMKSEGKLTVAQQRPKFIVASFLFYTLCLLKISMDLAHSLAASFTHYHLLRTNVGAPDAEALLLVSVLINLIQWVLWYGGLKFQRSLLLLT